MALKAQQVEFLLSENAALAGGTATFYAAGSAHGDSDKKAIWEDRNKVDPMANPVTLDESGKAVVYADGVYDVVLKNAAEVDILNLISVEIASKTSTTFYDVAADFGGDLAAALSSPLTVGKTVVVSTAVSCGDLTRPADRQIRVEYGGSINPATGKTFNWNSGAPVDSPKYRIYAGLGVITGLAQARPEWWGGLPDGSTDCTTALQAAINALGWHKTTFDTLVVPGYVAGGGDVLLSIGRYVVNDTLYYPGAVSFVGLGRASVIDFQPTVDGKDLFARDAAKPTRSSYAFEVQFRNLTLSGDLRGPNNYARYGINAELIHDVRLQKVQIQNFKTGLYLKDSYYTTVDQCIFTDNYQYHIHSDTGAQPITVTGGRLHYTSDFTTVTPSLPTEMVLAEGAISFNGTAFEPRDRMASTAAIIRGRGGIVVNPAYVESNYPLLVHDLAKNYYAQSTITPLHNAGPLLKFENFDLSAVETGFSTQFSMPVAFHMNPKNTRIIFNSSFQFGAYGWTIPTAHGTNTYDSSADGIFNNIGSYKAVHSGDGANHFPAYQTIPAAALAPFVGRRVWVAWAVKKTGTFTEFYCRAYQYNGASLVNSKRANKVVDYGNGWELWVADIGILPATPAGDMIIDGSAKSVVAGSTVWLAHCRIYTDGWEPVVYTDDTETIKLNAAPTTGTWPVGYRIYRATPTVGQPKSWVCTVGGTPGTWVSEGNL